ncbi:MAG: fibronectin type III domain-containing protein [Chloroflexi bacterium]|nr:fibronectin type III domain-containing protein [Chloroflexota bacterium]
MAPRPNLRSGIACLIAWLLSLATACEAEPAPPATATAEPALAVTSTGAPPPTPTAPEVPVGEVREVFASSAARGELWVGWAAADPEPHDYHLSWARVDGEYPDPSDAAGNAFMTVRSDTLTGLDPGATYMVRVRARYADGSADGGLIEGPWSPSAAARVNAPPLAPSGLTAVATHQGVELEWNDPGDESVAYYTVVRTSEDDPYPTDLATTTDTRFFDRTVDPETRYFYAIRATNADGDSPLPERAPVTTLARIPGRDDLYEEILPPAHATTIWWHWDARRPAIREMTIDFTIHNDVGHWKTMSGYYLMLGFGWISDVAFYFGVQTRILEPGITPVRGAIFSRWETRDLANARTPSDGWADSSGHEGDFIGVRRAYDWNAGEYRARIAPDGRDADGEWFSFWITDLRTGITTWIGALKFPLVGGTAAMAPDIATTLELFGSPARPIDAPEWYVTVERPVGDGAAPARVITEYPSDNSPNPMRNSNVRYNASESAADLRIGGITERVDPPQRYWSE